MIIDGHAYCFPARDETAGISLYTKSFSGYMFGVVNSKEDWRA